MIEYIGLPYDLHNRNGFNCFGLVGKVYADKFGADVPVFLPKSKRPRDIAATFAAAFASGEHGFKKVDKPSNYCVVVFKKKRAVTSYHCGVYIDGKVLHCGNTAPQSVYQSIEVAGDGFDEVEFWQR